MDYIHVNGWQLLDNQNEQVAVGQLFDYPDKKFEVSGGSPPHKPSSTGRVYGSWTNTEGSREYFPTVFGLRWVEY